MPALSTSIAQVDALRAILALMAGDVGKVYPERRGGQIEGYMVAVWVGEPGSRQRFKIRHAPLSDGRTWVRITHRKVADAILRVVRERIAAGDPPLAAIAPFLREKAPDLLFRRCWERFCEAKGRQGHGQLSDKRLDELEGHRRRGHLDALLELPAHQIGYAQLEELRDHLFDGGLAAGSVHHVLADIGTCFRWLHRRQEVPRVPPLPSVKIPEHTPRIPSPAQVQQLLDAIPWHLRGQWLARSQLGLRPSEAQRANVADWRFEPEAFRLRDGSEMRAHTITIRGKGGRVRVLPVPATWELAVWIDEHREAKDALRGDAAPLFANPAADLSENPAGRWTKASSRRVWLAACRTCSLMESQWTPRFTENESMRHAFATHSVALPGADLALLSELMGHADIRTTRRYRKLGPGAFLEVVKR